MSEAPVARLLSLLGSEQEDLRLLAVNATGFLGRLRSSIVETLAAIVRDTSDGDEHRATALVILERNSSTRFSAADLYSYVVVDDSVLSLNATYLYANRFCEQEDAGYPPSRRFEKRLSGLLSDPKVPVRFEAARCFLAWGLYEYEPKHSLVRRSIRILGDAMLDAAENPISRGSAIRVLSRWLESRIARRLLRRMFDESNWFFGAAGNHFPVHSLYILSGLCHSNWTWAEKHLARLAAREDRILEEEGGSLALWRLERCQ